MHSKALLKLNRTFGVILLNLCLLSACGYSVSVNDNVVYMPPSLFTDYRISDPNLATCVKQSIIDQQVASAKNLRRLNCSNAGIVSLAGLEVFGGLEEMNLAQNRIKAVDELAHLSQLRVLILSENPLQNIAPLLSLLHLRTLDVSGAPELSCGDIRQLEQNWADLETKLVKPAQCH